ncbi:phage holin family protein [Paenibacillus sp. JNUCC31]|nr:phage holin family protein [Paenibacillus sp. JNUCC-31]
MREEVSNVNPSVSTFAAISGAIMTFAFGGWDQLLSLLAVAMAVDYITGLAAAVRSGDGLNSNIGFWGLARKGLMLTVILLAHRIDMLMGTDIIKGGAIYFYLVNELISITENYARIGLPLPNKLRQAIAVLKKQEDLSDREWPQPQPDAENKKTEEQPSGADKEKQSDPTEQGNDKLQ